ncbi:hypothetical protein RWE15_13190 [Virgibacillus halophilus]|uniref:Uncharacterized protein n=2 Tax=Tigheibacillus halophilus TaxID=361280 RepID=A0ABU5C9I2_9BACI|nr:hypothetical protein [Virgibacillus halophilus]
MAVEGLHVDITAPTLMKGETELSGYAQAIHVGLNFQETDQLNVHLVLD